MNDIEHRTRFNQWLTEHRGLLFKVVRAYSINHHDSEDLFQEIAVQLWNSIPSYQGNCAETTWIYRVAFYSACTWSKKEKSRRQSREKFEAEHPVLSQTSVTHDTRLDWLYEQISQMDEPDRTLTLLLLDGFQYRDMAEITGLSESNVGVRINRIKNRLTTQTKENQNHGL